MRSQPRQHNGLISRAEKQTHRELPEGNRMRKRHKWAAGSIPHSGIVTIRRRIFNGSEYEFRLSFEAGQKAYAGVENGPAGNVVAGPGEDVGLGRAAGADNGHQPAAVAQLLGQYSGNLFHSAVDEDIRRRARL